MEKPNSDIDYAALADQLDAEAVQLEAKAQASRTAAAALRKMLSPTLSMSEAAAKALRTNGSSRRKEGARHYGLWTGFALETLRGLGPRSIQEIMQQARAQLEAAKNLDDRGLSDRFRSALRSLEIQKKVKKENDNWKAIDEQA